jgi:uncharacterized protein YpbB
MIDALVFEEYLYKNDWMYPVLWITELWAAVIYRDKALKENLETLNQFVVWKVWLNIFSKKSKKSKKSTWNKIDTKLETLKLFKTWLKLEEIVKKRELKLLTIEWHILDLYELGEISLTEILKLVSFANLKKVKETINNDFNWEVDKLKPIKEKLEEKWEKNISYFEIKTCILMMKKWDF